MNRFQRLAHEAHRRSIWQVLLVYLVGAYVALEVIGTLMDVFGLPDWVAPLALVLFIVGLPIVLATAIVQEGAPDLPGSWDDRLRERRADRLEGLQSAGDVLNEQPRPEPLDEGGGSVHDDGGARHGLAGQLTWRRAVVAGIAAFVLLTAVSGGYVALRSAGIGPMGSLLGQGVLEERAPVVLAEFDSPAQDSSLAQVVTEALRIDLSESPTLTVVDRGYIADALRRMQRDPTEPLTGDLARDLAARDGLRAVIEGEVVPAGRSYLLTARIVTPDGTELAGFRETATSADDVIGAADALSAAIRSKVGESLASIRASSSLERVSTSSIEALRLYSQAIRDMEMGGGANWQQAGARLQEAVSLDPNFGMAWRKLGVYHGSWERRYAADSAYTRAYELRDRLTPPERALASGSYFQYVLQDPDRAAAAYEALLETHDEPVAVSNLADIRSDEGRYEEAEALLRRAIETQARPMHYHRLISIVYGDGRRDEAKQLYREAADRFGEEAFELAPLHFAVAEQDWARADSAIDRIASSATDVHERIEANGLRSNLLALRGRFDEALALLQPLLEQMEQQGASLGIERALMPATIRAVIFDDTVGTAARVRQVLEEHPLDERHPVTRPYQTLVLLLTRSGQPDLAEHYFQRALREQAPSIRPEHRHAARGLIAAARGDHELALQEWRAAHARRTCRGACFSYELAEAYDRVGMTEPAIVHYREFLDAPELYRIYTDVVDRPRALFRLAELLEERGDEEEAARRYAEFVELMRDTDPVFQDELAEARRRLARIVAE